MTNTECIAIRAALEMVDSYRWGQKRNVVGLVLFKAEHHPEGYGRVSPREIAEHFGHRQSRNAEHLLAELVAAKVLKARAPAVGTLPVGYAVNPSFWQWEVPWYRALNRETIVMRVERAVGAVSRLAEGHNVRLVPLRSSGAQAELVPLRSPGALKPAARASAPLPAGALAADTRPSTYRGTSSEPAPPHMPYCPPYEKPEREHVASIKAAIAGQGGWLNGKPERRLAELIAEGLAVDDAVTVIGGRDWSTHLPEVRGKRIFDYLEARAAMIPAEAAELRRAQVDARRAEERAEQERAELRRREEEEAAALQKWRENPAVAADRLDMVWSSLGGRPVSENGHNGQNGKEPTGA